MFGFAYVGGATYVYQGPYGLGASEFGLLFGVTAALMGLGSIAAHRLTGRISQGRLALLGAALIVVGAIAALTAVHLALPIGALAGAIGVAMCGAGMAEPVLMGVAMSSRDDNLGSASALLGSSQFVLGAAASAIAAPAATAGPLVWTGLLLATSLLVALLTAGVAATTTGKQPASC
ncbi:hypothetical protein ACQI4L_19480 [Mycolicibacterium litorale]|uniref:hypothetical protein n=1 Tax=Mycolicibacterium litorale TaxID=758802 RepID=UPI003CE7F492